MELSQSSWSAEMIDYFLFDLDGTITTEELLPRIARAIGVEEKIKKLTELTIAGDIPFEYSLQHRVEILSVAPVVDVQRIVAGVSFDQNILSFIRANANRCRVITGNLDVWIADLIPILGIPIFTSTAEVCNGYIKRLVSINDKKKVAQSFSGKICAIGDGANDLGMLEMASIGIAYGGVHAPARQLFDVATHHIIDGGTLCHFLSQL